MAATNKIMMNLQLRRRKKIKSPKKIERNNLKLKKMLTIQTNN
jgi:hypothetical protein